MTHVGPHLPYVKANMGRVRLDRTHVRSDLLQVKPHMAQVKSDMLHLRPYLPHVKPYLRHVKTDTGHFFLSLKGIMNLRRILPLLPALFFLLCSPGSSSAKETAPPASSCFSTGWPQDQSDLKPDSALTFGTLENGVRYVIMPNKEPKNRVGLYLNVQAGSLHETEAQRGVAHYLEHMLFNGTRHYPAGKLVEYFQSIGMAFGPDTNAHTSYDETVYKLLLPDGGEKHLNEGLLVLADYAAGALLEPKEVERERGIILAEKRERDSAARRVFKADMEQVFAGTLVAQRDVIGADEVLKTADAALLRQYYQQWYQPGNMIVAAVGDTDTALAEALIKKHFSPLKAEHGPTACPDFGQVAEGGISAYYQREPDLGHTELTLASVWNVNPEAFTKAAALRRLKEGVAGQLLNNRLRQLTSRKDSPLTSAYFYSAVMFGRVGVSTMKAKSSAEQWQASLDLLNLTLRQALTEGFAEPELNRAKEEVMSQLRQAAESAASRKSDEIAAVLVSSINSDEVPLSPQQELELYGPALEVLTLAEVNQSFRSLWPERRLIKAAGTLDLSSSGPSPEERLLAVFKAAEAAELKPWTAQAEAVFPYLPEPEQAAELTGCVTHSKIGAETCTFSNGLILNLKKTDFEPNELSVAAVFGKGLLSEPKPGLAVLSEMLLPESGVGKLDQEQLKAALAKYSFTLDFGVDDENFQFKGQALKSEIEQLFQLLHTRLHDPAFRADAFERVRRKTEQLYAQMRSSVEGMMQLRGEGFLAGGNPRYGLPPLEALQKLTLAEIEGWLAPALREEPLEISVVGDFDQAQVLKLAAKYFGGPRKGSQQGAGTTITFPAGQQLKLNVATATGKALAAVAWPTDDFWDIARTRRLGVLAAVLDDRLRKQIRESLGAAYSPYVYNQSSTVDPGHGVLRAVLLAEPGQAGLLAKKLRQAGAEMAAGKVTQEELTRALEPTLTSIRDMVRTNRYWLDSVLISSSRHPQRLDWPTTIQSDFAAVKPEEIAALAAKYLQPDKAAEIILLPEAPAKEDAVPSALPPDKTENAAEAGSRTILGPKP
uniref:M16 family metallopeptidase n=1 Tax=Candidatus Electronema sp. TaxID=2698783 RepID=UPI004056395D